MRPHLAVISLLALTVLGGCQESPSFRLRWDLRDRPDQPGGDEQAALPVTRAIDCTRLGINTVRVTAIDSLGDIADQRYFPCYLPRFADEATDVGGPHLDDGTYAIEVRGVQRDGKEWLAPVPVGEQDDSIGCDPRKATIDCGVEDVACACSELMLPDVDHEWPHTFVLDAPSECIDGIDNDRDGLVDSQEVGCTTSIDARESDNVGSVQFRATVSLFDGDPNVTCTSVGLGSLSARICPVDANAECSEPIATLPCRAGEPIFFDAGLLPGNYVVELRGVGDDTQTIGVRSEPFEVDNSGTGASVVLEADFGADDFDPPVSKPVSFVLDLESDPDSSRTRLCGLPSPGTGTLIVNTIALELRDGHGGVLADPPEADFGLTNETLDGRMTGCSVATIETETLSWGGYSLRAQAFALDGTVCFTTDGQHGRPDAPIALRPGDQPMVIPRVLSTNGVPPVSCVDCDSDAECGNGLTCDSGICR